MGRLVQRRPKGVHDIAIGRGEIPLNDGLDSGRRVGPGKESDVNGADIGLARPKAPYIRPEFGVKLVEENMLRGAKIW